MADKTLVEDANGKKPGEEGYIETVAPDNNPGNKTDDDVDAKIQEALKPIKEKLDKAYEARDAEKKRADDLAAKERERELADLRKNGEHEEVHKRELAEERRLAAEEKSKREAAERLVVELTRDNQLRTALSAYPFRNGNAMEMANRELVQQLVRNDAGVWVTRAGVSIADAVKSFHANEDNAFLFKPKQNSGGGSGNQGKPSNEDGNKPLSKMTQDEVMKLAAEGKLPSQQRRAKR